MNIREVISGAEALAREKNLDIDEVLEAIEQAIQKAARTKFGLEKDIRAKIVKESGELELTRCREVVEVFEDPSDSGSKVLLSDARRESPKAELGDVLVDHLPNIDFGRVAAQTARQVITQRIREAERTRNYNEYIGRVSEIINGTIRRFEFGNAIVDLGKTEAILRRDEIIPRENLRIGDRVRAYIMDVKSDVRGPQIFLSRTHPQFMAQLFAQEVPEIYDGVIQIVGVARDPGSRAKIAVFARDSSIDPIGACVGMRGSRVQNIVNELQGEKIDIVPWSDNLGTFIVSALVPAEVVKVIVDEERNKVDVVVPDDQLSLAIGRRGQNVRLAAQLVGFDIDVLTEAQESERRSQNLKARTELFTSVLDVDDVIAHILAVEGFVSIEDIVMSDTSEIAAIEGFDDNVAAEIQARANVYLVKKNEDLRAKLKEMKVNDDLLDVEGVSLGMVHTLATKNILSRDALAELAGDELRETLKEHNLSHDVSNEIIMKARAHWFDEDADK
ncbi:MAG: transcription termination/antitermination protein NusA [Alphaproteobacteria bacterium]|nr:MAG: transcription termination/antitermination protein NusA [Alphaproteobacteria bacterium]